MEVLGVLALVSGVQRPLDGYPQPQTQNLSGSPRAPCRSLLEQKSCP